MWHRHDGLNGRLFHPGIFPVDAHVEFWRSGSLSRGYPCPLHKLGRLDSWSTLADYFGACGALYSVRIFHQPRSQSVNSLLHPTKRFCAFVQHQQQNDILLDNLTNLQTNITLIPGSLEWDSLLPPIIHSHHAFHIHSIHTQAL